MPEDTAPIPQLPTHAGVRVDRLTAGFDHVTNAYKFYWFLALLERLQEERERVISVDELLIRMLAAVWYPVNYFRLSFGKQDRLDQIVSAVREETQLAADAPRRALVDTLQALSADASPARRAVTSLGQYVPYRFLRPFFDAPLRGRPDWQVNNLIVQLAADSFAAEAAPAPYRFTPDRQQIEVHPLWGDYLRTHAGIVQGFCLWHLLNYLQKHNPNVPNVAAKLFPPAERALRRGRQFWRLALDALGSVACIYSGDAVDRDNFSLDHFLPWSFVAHDLLWNLIPAPRRVNSAKSAALPDFDRYFDPFAQLQYAALQAVDAARHPVLVEDYTVLFKRPSVAALHRLEYDEFRAVLHATLAPQFQVARNMGFAAGWRYREP